MAEATGQIVQVTGGVVDVDFGSNPLPELFYALEIPLENEELPLVLEVQNHLGNGWVRTLAMDSTDGLVRGQESSPLLDDLSVRPEEVRRRRPQHLVVPHDGGVGRVPGRVRDLQLIE